MEPSTLNLLLSQKIQSLNTIATVGMTWWVSSVVFCGSILAGVWLKRQEVAHAAYFGWLRVILGFFFFSVVIFGIWLAVVAQGIDAESRALISQIGGRDVGVSWMSLGITVGVLIGTTSFVLVTAMWFVLWRSIEREHRGAQGRRARCSARRQVLKEA